VQRDPAARRALLVEQVKALGRTLRRDRAPCGACAWQDRADCASARAACTSGDARRQTARAAHPRPWTEQVKALGRTLRREMPRALRRLRLAGNENGMTADRRRSAQSTSVDA
jgi:hypothetical protein